jgi:hypothetical protein
MAAAAMAATAEEAETGAVAREAALTAEAPGAAA